MFVSSLHTLYHSKSCYQKNTKTQEYVYKIGLYKTPQYDIKFKNHKNIQIALLKK